MEIMRAGEFGNDVSEKISEIFVDGFYQWLKFFSRDKEKLAKAFRHMFNLDVFYVAFINGDLAGIAACTDGMVSSVHLDRNELKRHLGFMMGAFTYAMLKKEFEEKPYPFEIVAGMGTIEFVAVSKKFRGQGVASQLIRSIFDATPYDTYVLEVADTNTNAVHLYEKLGFAEFGRVKQKHSKQSGVTHLVYMKYTKDMVEK